MALEFEEYKGKAKDTDEESTVRAATVSKDDAGEEVTVIGGTRKLGEGDVVVERDRPGLYDVLSADQWKDTGYSTGSPSSASTGTASDSDDGSNTGAKGQGAKQSPTGTKANR